MNVYIEVIEGIDKGLRFKAKDGLRIGRTVGEITLNDGKISSLHAQIEKDQSGKFILKDLGSSNGIFIDARRVKKVLLIEGVTFSMGKTKFRVQSNTSENLSKKLPPALQTKKDIPQSELKNEITSDAEPETKDSNANKVDVVKSSYDETKSEIQKEPDLSTWNNVFKHFLTDYNVRHLFKANINLDVKAFKNPVLLKFISGMQSDQQWLLGWGPRTIGRDSLELRLLDSLCPEKAFSLKPSKNGSILFQTDYPRLVLVNEKSKSTCEVRHGDRIQIADNIIEILILDSSENRLELEDD